MKGGDDIFVNITKLSANSAQVGMVNKRTGQLFQTTHTRIRKGLCLSHAMWMVQEWADAVENKLELAHFGEVVLKDLRWETADKLSWYPSDATGPGQDYWVLFGIGGLRVEQIYPEGWRIDARCEYVDLGGSLRGVKCRRVCEGDHRDCSR